RMGNHKSSVEQHGQALTAAPSVPDEAAPPITLDAGRLDGGFDRLPSRMELVVPGEDFMDTFAFVVLLEPDEARDEFYQAARCSALRISTSSFDSPLTGWAGGLRLDPRRPVGEGGSRAEDCQRTAAPARSALR